MDKPCAVFKGQAEQIAGVDIDGPLTNAEFPCCDYYYLAYSLAAKQKDDEGDQASAWVYRYLQELTSFQSRFDLPTDPFSPKSIWEGQRSLAPSDLTPPDIDAIKLLAPQSQNPSLRARLHDLLWVLSKDHRAGKLAVDDYIASATLLEPTLAWTIAVDHYLRGVWLASKFGRKNEWYLRASAALIEAARRSASDSEDYKCCKLLEAMIELGVGEQSEFAALSGAIAATAESARKAQFYWELQAKWFNMDKDFAAEKEARVRAGEAAVLQAEQRAAGTEGSFTAGAMLLTQAIELLRRAKAPKERISELRKMLAAWQSESMAEMQHFAGSIDLPEAIRRAAVEHVKDDDPVSAILKFAFGQPLSNPERLKTLAQQEANDHPLSNLFETLLVDDHGRVIAKQPGLLDLQGEKLDEALLGRAFSRASRYDWPCRVANFILPALEQIVIQHRPDLASLRFMVENNPFIPPDHEAIFARGIYAGFCGDFLIASHLLTPQIENSLRYVLESRGVDCTKLESDGVQPLKVFGGIFGLPETETVFGKDLCFEIRGCLIEKSGYDFRNRVAHGFVGENDCYSNAAITVWWLTIRMCLSAWQFAQPQVKSE